MTGQLISWWQRPPRAPPKRARLGVAFWALYGFTVILLLAPQVWIPALNPLHLAAVAGGIGFCARLYQSWEQREPVLAWRPELWLAAGIGTWALVTAPLSYWPGGSAVALFGQLGKSLVIFWMLAAILDDAHKLRRLLWLLSLLSLPLALTGLQHFRSGQVVEAAGISRILGYQAPLTANPNDLGLLLNLLLPFTIALFVTTRRLALRILLAGTAIASIAAIIVTFSRAAFTVLALGFALLFWRLLRRGTLRLIVLAGATPLALLAMAPQGYIEHLHTIIAIGDDPTGSAAERLSDTAAALEVIVRHPVMGTGLGMHGLALNEIRGETWRYVHNAYLQVAADLGLVALLVYVLLGFTCWRLARRAATSGAAAVRPLAEASSASLALFAVAAFFHPAAYHFYFFYIGGIAASLRNLIGRDDNEHPAR